MAAIDRVLHIGNATVRRATDGLISVPRMNGKIALEEAVGTKYFNAAGTLPVTQQVTGYDGLPFEQRFEEDVIDRLMNISKRIEDMDNAGVGYVVVSLTSPGIQGVFDTANATKLATAVNDEIYNDYVAAYPERFGFFAAVAMQDPAGAAMEIERAVTHLGAKGALINSYSNVGPPDNYTVQYLDHARCDVFWQKVAELDIPVYLHPRPPPPDQQRVYNDEYNTKSEYPMLVHAAYGFGADTGAHAARLMLSGLFDRYPNIQIILGHAAEALPFFVHRLDTRLAIGTVGTNGPYKRTMKHYLRNNFWATIAGIRRLGTVLDTVQEMGEDRVLFSIDYPYESSADASDWFDNVEGLGVKTKKKIAWENAERFLGIAHTANRTFQIAEDFL